MADLKKREEILAYVDQLITATVSGTMMWRVVNPTTFLWSTSSPQQARITLQRVDRKVPGTAVVNGRSVNVLKQDRQFVFQAFDNFAPNSSPVVSWDSGEDVDLNTRLAALFEAIGTAITQKSLDFLQSILPKT